ncbi:MAG: hypothetical protein SVM80_03545 [Halobacteriota archaeon]|nr:hypothetical protein [Halobacteriota archaeon]
MREWDEEDPSRLRISDVDISAEALSEGEALLTIITYIDNRGGPAEDVSVLVKAFDSDTNLLTVENRTDVGEITRKKTSIVRTNLSVPKEGGYRLEIVLFDAEKISQSTGGTIQGLSMLEPPSTAKVSIRDIDFMMKDEVGDHVTVESTIYIDNIGKEDTSGLRALVKARDSETKLIVDESWMDLGTLEKDATTSKSIDLNLLNTRNYEVYVQIWLDQKIIKQGSGLLMLGAFGNGTQTIQTGVQMITTTPEVKATDFISADEDYYLPPSASYEEPMAEAPGFESYMAIIGICIVSVFLIRRRRR